ncbi:MAG: DEAD/DEAH box helicase [Myxococcaceae bacterium]|nr:DEAD/DEAH box helicase [Myxococcaceae bacterium]
MGASLQKLLVADYLRELADPSSFARGVEYARSGRVQEVSLGDQRVTARVQGADGYRVELEVQRERELVGRCTCPLGLRGVFCKHCVATALAASADAAWRDAGVAAPTAAADEPLEHDAQLEELITRHRLDHVHRLGADVLLGLVPERERASLRYVFGRQGFTDFATLESIRRYGFALAHAPRIRSLIPPAALKFLRAEIAAVEAAREDVPARITPPAHLPEPALKPFSDLVQLRSRHGTALAPRPRETVNGAGFAYLDALPGFAWTDDRSWLGPSSHVPVGPKVALVFGPRGAEARCSTCAEPCVHSLAAVDAALLWFAEPLTDERRAIIEELARPPWERALQAIERAVEEASRSATPTVVSWRLELDRLDRGVFAVAWLQRANKKGSLNAGHAIDPRRLLEDLGASLSPQDQRLASLCPESTFRPAGRAFLTALIGHPRVFDVEDPGKPLQVESARVGLLADDRGGSVVLVPALDGAPLPKHIAEALTRPDVEHSPPVLYDRSAHRLTILDVPAEVRCTAEVLQRFGNDFPPESHAALVEKLSTLSARVPVAMPRSVMGEAVPPQIHPVLRLEVQPDTSVRLELRIRPLPESAAFLPADGARDVHVRRAGEPVHARRDFVAETAAAEALAARLPLEGAQTVEPFVWILPDAQRALAFLSALDGWTGGRPELEWRGEPIRLVGRVDAAALRVQLEKKRDWFGVLGGLSVQGERVSLAVVLDAARRRQRFVRVEKERYVEIADALRRHLERLSDHTWSSPNGLEIGPAAVDVVHALENEGAKVDTDRTWRALAERIFAAKELTPQVPRSLKAKLRDYQVEGFRWMTRLAAWGAGAVLADDMGLGKTVQALAVLLDRAKKGPALVVAPTSVGFNWLEEAARFAPSLKLQLYAESDDRGATLERLGPRDVLVLSYGLLARDWERLSKVSFATIVFDEAQALKNAATHRARAARELRGEFKIALSGTPLENHLGELWSIFRIVFPGLLGSWEAFRDRYAQPIEKRIDPTAAPALSRVLQPFLLRRTKAQVAQELPAKTEMRVPVVLSKEEWALYEDARLAALAELETPRPMLREQQRRVQVLAALTRLRLLASHPRLYDPSSKLSSSKLERLLELIDELRAEGHRALVFSQFTSHLALVREVLDARGVSYVYLDGRTPRAERERRVRAFQEGDAPLFLISLKAGGFGLNLTGADNVIHLDPWWNPAVEDQAADRAHRIGQHRPVTVYRLVAKGTIEEQILALHEDKRALVSGVLEGKDQAARLSTRELLALLSRPAASLAVMDSPSDAKH